MKTTGIVKKATVTFLVMVFLVGMSFARPKPAKEFRTLKSLISKNITYPQNAVKNYIKGIVYVKFTVMPDGSVRVDETDSQQDDLKDYVVKEMANVKLPENVVKQFSGNSFLYKFSFVID